MTGEELIPERRQPRSAVAWLERFPPPLRREGRRLSLILLGYWIVFALALGHDEIVAECVDAGLIAPAMAETAELLAGLVLFLGWSALTVCIVRLVDRAREGAPR